jgi:hypothetical protein
VSNRNLCITSNWNSVQCAINCKKESSRKRRHFDIFIQKNSCILKEYVALGQVRIAYILSPCWVHTNSANPIWKTYYPIHRSPLHPLSVCPIALKQQHLLRSIYLSKLPYLLYDIIDDFVSTILVRTPLFWLVLLISSPLSSCKNVHLLISYPWYMWTVHEGPLANPVSLVQCGSPSSSSGNFVTNHQNYFYVNTWSKCWQPKLAWHVFTSTPSLFSCLGSGL